MDLKQILAFLAPFEGLLMPIVMEEENKVQAWVKAELAKDGLPVEVNAFLMAVDQALTDLANAELAKLGKSA